MGIHGRQIRSGTVADNRVLLIEPTLSQGDHQINSENEKSAEVIEEEKTTKPAVKVE